MSSHPFKLSYGKLPASLPIFPLPNAVVMPGCQLPLNIFEPRYLNMVFDALGADRMVGMVQPDPGVDGDKERVYRTGTAGRISLFNETNDGRLMIVLSGVCRFDIQEEISTIRGYRRVVPDWSRFRCDYGETDDLAEDRQRLMRQLKAYFESRQIEADWESLEAMPAVDLINRLTSVMPFEVAERQLLIDAVSTEERAAVLSALLQCEAADSAGDSSLRH